MPKFLFYAGTAACFLLALVSGGEVWRVLGGVPAAIGGTLEVVTSLAAGLAIAALFLRMASLLAARDLFAAFVAAFSITAAAASLAAVLFVQWQMASSGATTLQELHFVARMVLGFFLSLSMLSLRPYFSIQASRFLAAMVSVPLPLFALAAAQEMLVIARTAVSQVFFSILSILFFSIAVHCIRHRHLFLEMTNLRELLDPRVDPAARPGRPIGGVAYDS